MKTHIFSGMLLCILLLMMTATTCEDEVKSQIPIAQVCGLHLKSLDNSGQSAVEISDNRCPKEAYMLKILPEVKIEEVVQDYHWCTLSRPITDIRIITLTDFSAALPAGSDISHLFYQLLSPAPLKFPVYDLWSDEFTLVLLTYPVRGTYQFRVEVVVGAAEGDPKNKGSVADEQQVFTAATARIEFY